MLHDDRNPYIVRRNDSGSALWIGIAVLLLLVIGGFMLVGPRGHERAGNPAPLPLRVNGDSQTMSGEASLISHCGRPPLILAVQFHH